MYGMYARPTVNCWGLGYPALGPSRARWPSICPDRHAPIRTRVRSYGVEQYILNRCGSCLVDRICLNKGRRSHPRPSECAQARLLEFRFPRHCLILPSPTRAPTHLAVYANLQRQVCHSVVCNLDTLAVFGAGAMPLVRCDCYL